MMKPIVKSGIVTFVFLLAAIAGFSLYVAFWPAAVNENSEATENEEEIVESELTVEGQYNFIDEPFAWERIDVSAEEEAGDQAAYEAASTGVTAESRAAYFGDMNPLYEPEVTFAGRTYADITTASDPTAKIVQQVLVDIDQLVDHYTLQYNQESPLFNTEEGDPSGLEFVGTTPPRYIAHIEAVDAVLAQLDESYTVDAEARADFYQEGVKYGAYWPSSIQRAKNLVSVYGESVFGTPSFTGIVDVFMSDAEVQTFAGDEDEVVVEYPELEPIEQEGESILEVVDEGEGAQ